METRNEKIIAAYQKYEQINPVKIESPGLSHAIKIGYEEVNVMTVAKLSEMSNAEIAQHDFQEEYWARRWVEALQECVKAHSTTIYGGFAALPGRP